MEVLVNWMKSAALSVAIVIPAAGSSSAAAEEQSITQLKDSYLACEHAARSTKLSGGEAMQCSITYEQLKQGAFNGDFRLLKIWYDTSRPSASASQ